MLKLIVSGVVLVAICGCLAGCNASGSIFSGLPPIKANEAQIVLYRPNDLCGGGMGQDIFIDDIKRSGLANGGYVLFEVDPGYHKIRVQLTPFSGLLIALSPVEVSIDIQPGKSYFLRYSIICEGYPTHQKFILEHMSTDIGITEIKDLKSCK